MATYKVVKTHHKSTLSCKSGDIINVALPENPTTGYKWHIVKFDGLKLKEDRFDISKTHGNMPIGAGGTRKLSFIVESDQPSTLQLKHYQEWEGVDSSDDTFALSFS